MEHDLVNNLPQALEASIVRDRVIFQGEQQLVRLGLLRGELLNVLPNVCSGRSQALPYFFPVETVCPVKMDRLMESAMAL